MVDATFECTLAEALEHVKLQVRRAKQGKTPRTVMLWGRPGIGKTDGCQAVAAEENVEFIPFNLAMRDPTDIKGLGKVTEDGYTQWSKDETFFPKNNGHRLVLIDDFTIAPPTLQAAAQELINNRQVGGRIISDKVILVMAGNYEKDQSFTSAMPASTANRPLHLFVVPKAQDWIFWAAKRNVHPVVLSAINMWENILFGDPKSSTPWPSPRSWYNMHRYHQDMYEDRGGQGMYPTFDETIVHGYLGGEAAVKFMTVAKDQVLMDMLQKIKDGKLQGSDPKIAKLTAPQQFAIVMGVVQVMDVHMAKDWLVEMNTNQDDIPVAGIYYLLKQDPKNMDIIYNADGGSYLVNKVHKRFGALLNRDDVFKSGESV